MERLFWGLVVLLLLLLFNTEYYVTILLLFNRVLFRLKLMIHDEVSPWCGLFGRGRQELWWRDVPQRGVLRGDRTVILLSSKPFVFLFLLGEVQSNVPWQLQWSLLHQQRVDPRLFLYLLVNKVLHFVNEWNLTLQSLRQLDRLLVTHRDMLLRNHRLILIKKLPAFRMSVTEELPDEIERVSWFLLRLRLRLGASRTILQLLLWLILTIRLDWFSLTCIRLGRSVRNTIAVHVKRVS